MSYNSNYTGQEVEQLLNKAGTALQEHQSLDGYVKDADLAEVATSGSYTDLSNKPTIPDTLADLSADASHRTVTDTEKVTWNAKSDFSGSYNDLTNKPTIPDISGKQDILVSGTNIKTINGTSVLGSGDIEIESGGSIPVVEVSGTSVALTANKFTMLTTVQTSTLTVTLNAVEDSSIYNEYMLQFSTGTTAPTVNFPSSIVWVETPVIEASKTYQVSIVDNKGIIYSW